MERRCENSASEHAHDFEVAADREATTRTAKGRWYSPFSAERTSIAAIEPEQHIRAA